jgi:Leucine-rich repeat (LRR) protein
MEATVRSTDRHYISQMPHGPLSKIAGFIPGELYGLSKRLTSVDLEIKRLMLSTLAMKNFDQFSYLKEFINDFRVMEGNKVILSVLANVSRIFQRIIADTKPLASILFQRESTVEDVYHLLGSSDLQTKIQEAQTVIDDCTNVLAQVLRNQQHELQIPQATATDIRGWFADEANQESLNGITSLDLNQKGLKCFPKEIFKLRNLESILNLKENNLTHLPYSIRNLSKLKNLDLASNQLTKLPYSFYNLIDLTYVDLSNNQLTALHSIGRLINLEYLILSNNQLTRLPYSIGRLINLKYLLLNKNNLTRLPYSIGNLKSLNTFITSNNLLKKLPDSIGELGNLTIFNVSNNHLSKLPNSLVQLIINKTRITLKENPIKELSPELRKALGKEKSKFLLSNQRVTEGVSKDEEGSGGGGGSK